MVHHRRLITSCIERGPVVGSINVVSAPAAGAPWPCLTSGWCLSRCDSILLATCDVSAGVITLLLLLLLQLQIMKEVVMCVELENEKFIV